LYHFYLLQEGGVEEEGAFHPYAIGDMPHGETGTILTFPHSNHYPIKDLGAYPVSLLDLDMYLHGITRADLGYIGVGFRLN
jgi:hypothetical protein